MIKILVCPDSFKGTLNAKEVVGIIASVFQGQKRVECRTMPLADGGEGSIELINAHLACDIEKFSALNPLGEPVDGYYLRTNDVAYIEVANVGGLHLLQKENRNPRLTNSYGTGQLIAHALDKLCGHIVLLLGGSATVDGGTGIMQAICGHPFVFQNPLFTSKEFRIPELKQAIENIKFTLVTDVCNTLTGKNGASYVFGPQKGADVNDVVTIETLMCQWLNQLQPYTSLDLSRVEGLGAAGGIGLPLVALNKETKIINGFDFFNDLLNYEQAIKWADVIITGEGCIDEQTEMGKGPGRLAQWGAMMGKRVIGIGGMVKIHPTNFNAVFATCNSSCTEVQLQRHAKSNLLAASHKVRAYLLD